MPIILRVRGLGPMVTDSVRRYSAGSLGSAATSTFGSSTSSLRHGGFCGFKFWRKLLQLNSFHHHQHLRLLRQLTATWRIVDDHLRTTDRPHSMHEHMPCSVQGHWAGCVPAMLHKRGMTAEDAGPHLKTDTTLAWQLKPKTMMGMANSACVLVVEVGEEQAVD